MSPTTILFHGETLLLDPAGALLWPRLSLLAVADLHLEKGTAAAAAGQLVPPWDTAQTLARLHALLLRHTPKLLITLGDTFHDDRAPLRLSPADSSLLLHLTTTTPTIWVRGNHDPAPHAYPGHHTPSHHTPPLTFRHQSHPSAQAEISGHYHPKARIPTRALTIARPCFLLDSTRIILPSFGAYTGGLDHTHPALTQLFPAGANAYLLGRSRLFHFPIPPLTSPAPTQPTTAPPSQRFG